MRTDLSVSGFRGRTESAEAVRGALRTRLDRLDADIAAETARPSDRGIRLAATLTTGLGLGLVGLALLPSLAPEEVRLVVRAAGLLLMAVGGGLAALRGARLRALQSARCRAAARLSALPSR